MRRLHMIRRRRISKDLKAVTELAGDQITPGLGTFALVLGGLALAGAAAYAFHLRRKTKNRPASGRDGFSEQNRPED